MLKIQQNILFYLNLDLVLHFKTAICSYSDFFFAVLSEIVWSKWFLLPMVGAFVCVSVYIV